MPKLLTSDELDLALATNWSAVHGHCEALRLRAEDACDRTVSLQADLEAAQTRIAGLEAENEHLADLLIRASEQLSTEGLLEDDALAALRRSLEQEGRGSGKRPPRLQRWRFA